MEFLSCQLNTKSSQTWSMNNVNCEQGLLFFIVLYNNSLIGLIWSHKKNGQYFYTEAAKRKRKQMKLFFLWLIWLGNEYGKNVV